MLKKLLYHGSFAILGVSLLLGMAVLQANGLKTTDGVTAADDASPEASAPDSSSTQAPQPIDAAPVADAATTPPVEAQLASAPAEMTAAPAAMTERPAAETIQKAPAPSLPAPALQDQLKTIIVFDAHHKSSTKKVFKMVNGVHSVEVYCKRLSARSQAHVVAKGETKKDDWVSLSVSALKSGKIVETE